MPTDTAALEACLPEDFRGPGTTFSRIAAGMSGAGVYRVEALGHPFVLKISSESEPFEHWRRKVQLRQLAASAGIAPRVVHVDEARRAVTSAFVADRSFLAWLSNPATRDAAIVRLAQTLRRLHGLPQPEGAPWQEPREFLRALWAPLWAGFALPPFVGEVVGRMLEETPPARERPLVLSHNDVNPTNLIFDGEHLLLLDWEQSGTNDPFYDLGAAAMFFRFDDATCLRLLSAYDGEAVTSLPPRFVYSRRLVSVLSAAAMLQVARQGAHAGATGRETLESTPTLADFYQRLRAGAVSPATADGQWQFALALIKNRLAL